MTNEEITAMFQANAALKHCSDDAAAKKPVEDAIAQMKQKYINENVLACAKRPDEFTLQDAFNILVQACESATTLESKYHPDSMDDEYITGLAVKRKKSLELVASCLMSMS